MKVCRRRNQDHDHKHGGSHPAYSGENMQPGQSSIDFGRDHDAVSPYLYEPGDRPVNDNIELWETATRYSRTLGTDVSITQVRRLGHHEKLGRPSREIRHIKRVWALSSRGSSMKFYDEEKTGEVRRALEGEILKWPGVTRKEMMGCLCYFRGRKFFAFLVTGAIVLTKLSEEARTELSGIVSVKPFEMSGRTAKTWLRVELRKPGDLRPILPYVRKSYEATLAK